MSFKQNNIVQAWLVLFLALCFGSALAAVHVTLAPTIENNKINETKEKVPELVWGSEKAQEMTQKGITYEIIGHQLEVEKAGKKAFYSAYEAVLGGKRSGWVIKSSGQGYADKIELLLGVDPKAEKVTGLFVLDQKETPGLGNKIIEPQWRGQFAQKATGKAFEVTKKGASAPHEIDSVTGATISSKAVTQIVNAALNDLRPVLEKK
jgi:H+/Na+-translocating ferredoxin:NAD+ oxidoreductase subunit G